MPRSRRPCPRRRGLKTDRRDSISATAVRRSRPSRVAIVSNQIWGRWVVNFSTATSVRRRPSFAGFLLTAPRHRFVLGWMLPGGRTTIHGTKVLYRGHLLLEVQACCTLGAFLRPLARIVSRSRMRVLWSIGPSNSVLACHARVARGLRQPGHPAVRYDRGPRRQVLRTLSLGVATIGLSEVTIQQEEVRQAYERYPSCPPPPGVRIVSASMPNPAGGQSVAVGTLVNGAPWTIVVYLNQDPDVPGAPPLTFLGPGASLQLAFQPGQHRLVARPTGAAPARFHE